MEELLLKEECFAIRGCVFEAELKTVKAILPEHHAQVLNYLKATGLRVGLRANFGAYPKATIQRFVL